MLYIFFILLMLLVFGNLLGVAMKAAWGLTKIVLVLVCLPIALIVLAFCGLFFIAIPALLILGVISLVKMLLVN